MKHYKDALGNFFGIDDAQPIPAGCVAATIAEIQAANTAKEAAAFAALPYTAKRAAEYPPIADYLDAKVKQTSTDPLIQAAGVAQESAYVAACQAVKAKYPKA